MEVPSDFSRALSGKLANFPDVLRSSHIFHSKNGFFNGPRKNSTYRRQKPIKIGCIEAIINALNPKVFLGSSISYKGVSRIPTFPFKISRQSLDSQIFFLFLKEYKPFPYKCPVHVHGIILGLK